MPKISFEYPFNIPITAFVLWRCHRYKIRLRCFHEKSLRSFVGFVKLKGLNAKFIAQTIDEFLSNEEFNPARCVGLGLDDCSTMYVRKSVQVILLKKDNNDFFFQCFPHR